MYTRIESKLNSSAERSDIGIQNNRFIESNSFNQQSEEHMQNKDMEKLYLLETDEMSIALKIQKIFANSDPKSSSSFLKLPEINYFCDDFHRKIYDKVLKPYSSSAENAFLSFFRFYSADRRNTLRKYQSRFNHALKVIETELYPLKQTNKENFDIQLDVINVCLYSNLNEMIYYLPWKIEVNNLFADEARNADIMVNLQPLISNKDSKLEIQTPLAQSIEPEMRTDYERKLVTPIIEKQALTIEKQALTIEEQALTIEKQSRVIKEQSRVIKEQSMVIEKQALAIEEATGARKQTVNVEKELIESKMGTLAVKKEFNQALNNKDNLSLQPDQDFNRLTSVNGLFAQENISDTDINEFHDAQMMP